MFPRYHEWKESTCVNVPSAHSLAHFLSLPASLPPSLSLLRLVKVGYADGPAARPPAEGEGEGQGSKGRRPSRPFAGGQNAVTGPASEAHSLQKQIWTWPIYSGAKSSSNDPG